MPTSSSNSEDVDNESALHRSIVQAERAAPTVIHSFVQKWITPAFIYGLITYSAGFTWFAVTEYFQSKYERQQLLTQVASLEGAVNHMNQVGTEGLRTVRDKVEENSKKVVAHELTLYGDGGHRERIFALEWQAKSNRDNTQSKASPGP